MHLHILASGSKGNAVVVEGPDGLILIDDGLSRKRLLERASELGLDMDDVACLVLTHEHADHVSGVTVWCNRWSGDMVATAGTQAGRAYLERLPFETVRPGDTFEAAGVTVTTFPTSHDVNEPIGMRFDAEGDSIGLCTDTGYLTDEALAALRDTRILALESNHDVRMLETGPYPSYLKARVASRRGHLSNAQAAEALPHLVGPMTETVVAMHISEKNNLPSIAVRTLAAAVGAVDANSTGTEAVCPDTGMRIVAAAQDRPLTIP